jgi:3-oxoacyl-[acyl-carrier-protein] synthase-3
MEPKIRSIYSALPNHLWTNAEIEALTGASQTFIETKIGVDKRYFLKKDESGVDLSLKAVENLFESESLNRKEVDLLVVVTQTPDYKIPQNSAILQHRLELSTGCACFDISLGCSGYVYALSIVRAFMLSEGLSNALLVTCDPYSKIMDKHDKNVMTLFGDAATVTHLSNDGFWSLGRADMGTDGSMHSALKIEHGGGKSPLLGVHASKVKNGGSVEDVRLNMIGRDVFNFVVKNVPISISRCLEKNNMTLDQVSYFALHQGSKHMLDYMASRVGIPEQKMLRNIHKYGNTVSSTVPLLLQDLMENKEGRLSSSTVLISGFGVGLSWATNILTYFEES